MNETRKTITLPSGGTVCVRKLSAYDFATHFGDVPVIAPEGAPGTTRSRATKKDDPAFGLKFIRLALTVAAGPIKDPDGKTRRIVDKKFHECAEDEITLEEFPQADADAIFNAVLELSGMKGGAADKAAKFPEESAGTDSTGPGSETLRETAVANS